MAKTEVPWTEAFLAMLSLVVVLIFILIYYCILPCVKYYKRRREEEEAWWQYDPRWNKDTFRGASSQYGPLKSSPHSSHSASPSNSFRGASHQYSSNLPDKVKGPTSQSSPSTAPKKLRNKPNRNETQESIIIKINELK